MTAKAAIADLRAALYEDPATARGAVEAAQADGFVGHCFHPIGDLGAGGLWDGLYAPLLAAMPDVERRDWIVMEGADQDGQTWVGTGGHWQGTFAAPWLDIPPTGRVIQMRYHDFFRVEGGKVVEMQSQWDVPDLMMQAGAWPMGPPLGRRMAIPGPASQDGLRIEGDGARAREIVMDMLAHMTRHPSQGGPEVMEMERFWHPRFTWYGPAGIGTGRGVAGFRAHHQIPFLGGMPDRIQLKDKKAAGLDYHFFGQGDYAATTGWPNMRQTITGDGWLGIAPAGKSVEMRSLDFWRLEDGLIRENWVMVDLLDVWRQLGVDVMARMRELTAGAP
ncbi:MAG: ester cyclase [Paracoccaceae bacterium]